MSFFDAQMLQNFVKLQKLVLDSMLYSNVRSTWLPPYYSTFLFFTIAYYYH